MKVEFSATISEMIFKPISKGFEVTIKFEHPRPIPSNIKLSEIAGYPKRGKIIIKE